jgi:hypothetical protein
LTWWPMLDKTLISLSLTVRQSKNVQFSNFKHSPTGMGKISKQRQLSEKMQYRAVWDLSLYKLRWILKFLFTHHLMNEMDNF